MSNIRPEDLEFPEATVDNAGMEPDQPHNLERRTVRVSRGVCPTARDSAMLYGALLTVAMLEAELARARTRIAELNPTEEV